MIPRVFDMPVYMIGFAESWATPEVCFSLQASGVRLLCFYRYNGKRKFARQKFVEYYPVTAPESNLNIAIDDLRALIARFQPETIIPCDDAALLVLARLDGSGGHCLAPAGEACQFALDKWAQIEAARASGHAAIFLVHARNNRFRPRDDTYYRVNLRNEGPAEMRLALRVLPTLRSFRHGLH